MCPWLLGMYAFIFPVDIKPLMDPWVRNVIMENVFGQN